MPGRRRTEGDRSGPAREAGDRRTAAVYEAYARDPRKARAWAAANPGNAAIRGELLDRVMDEVGPQLSAQSQVLDIGCGTGWWLRALTSHGIDPDRLHGVDALPERVRSARSSLPGAHVEVGDACDLPLADRSFGVVLLFTLLSSLPDRQAVRLALREARRVTAPGGALLVYEPRVPNPANRATRYISRRELARSLDGELRTSSLTLVPALARRLGRATERLYPALSQMPLLRTHRLSIYRVPGDGAPGGS